MTLLGKNIIVSVSLAISDLVSFITSMYLALAFIAFTSQDYIYAEPASGLEGWQLLHSLLAFCCVGWYSMRLRHYFYRKTFWFELKEILRTLVIFGVIEIAVLSFTNWNLSRYLWLLTWLLILCLVPVARMGTKRILDILGLWRRDTWIIGSGDNALEAYKAISSEANLGLVVVGFISSEDSKPELAKFNNIPVLSNDIKWLSTVDRKTQFIVAVESHQSDIRNTWLRNFMIKGFRYVSVIPTLRGMPLNRCAE